jgi:hypothetical protein
VKKFEKQIEDERLIKVSPYRDEKDFGLLERLPRKTRARD